MTDDEQLEQAIRDAEVELAGLRQTIDRRVDEALKRHGLSNEALIAKRDQRRAELQSARDELKAAQRRQKSGLNPPAHELPLIFVAVCWFFMSIFGFSANDQRPALIRLGVGVALALISWRIAASWRKPR